jgi:hypothetical protein
MKAHAASTGFGLSLSQILLDRSMKGTTMALKHLHANPHKNLQHSGSHAHALSEVNPATATDCVDSTPLAAEEIVEAIHGSATSAVGQQSKTPNIADLPEEQCLRYFRARLGKLKKKTAKEYLAHCPFHDDKHPSLSINTSKKAWYCLTTCKTGGGLIDFEMKYASEVQGTPCSKQQAWAHHKDS